MQVNDKVQYIGKGFLGFDLNITEMTVLEVEAHDVWVEYRGQRMLVRDYEIK